MPSLNLGRVGFVNKGAWSVATAYKINDVVTYTNGTFAALQAHTGQTPVAGGSAYWQEWVTPDNTAYVASAIHGATDKATPVDADEIGIADSAAAFALKKLTWANLKATAKTYFDTLYVALTGAQSIAGIKTFTSGINAPQLVGLKNYLINGNFGIWQYAISQTSSGYGSDSRWINGNTGSTKTHTQQASTDTERPLFNASFFSRTAVASVAGASNYVSKQQRIENVNKLANKTVTLSFWAKADASKNIAIEFVQDFGTGGAPSAQVTAIGSQLVALTTTWTRYSVSVAIPSIVGKTIGTDGSHTSYTGLHFWFDAGSSFDARTATLGQQSGTFDIAQVQVEDGAVATPFEQRPYGLELNLCRRYYRKFTDTVSLALISGQCTTTTTGIFTLEPLMVSMRTVPSVSFSSQTGFSVTNAAGGGVTSTAISMATPYRGTVTVAAGLVAGDGTILAINANESLGLTSEL